MMMIHLSRENSWKIKWYGYRLIRDDDDPFK